MSRINVAKRSEILTHEGGKAVPVNAEQQLRRLTLATLLWEDQFYVDGVSIADAIADAVTKVKADVVAKVAIEAREKQKLRHLPLLLVRELARRKDNPKGLVADTLASVIQRPDELAEFLAIYWKEKKEPLAAQVKKGLARAFEKFNEYSLAKYDRDSAIKLRDVLFLTHPKPTKSKEKLYKKIAERKLKTPDTWEVTLSAGEGKKTEEDKKQRWERLLKEEKLGALALIRNLRNMEEAGVKRNLIKKALENIEVARVLPFRFISAAKYAPSLEAELEQAMFKCVSQQKKLKGKTILVIDTSGSMYGGGNVSEKSDITRVDAAAALAILVREIAEEPVIYCTAGDDYSRKHDTALIPSRRGFSLSDVITKEMPNKIGGGGIFLVQCLDYIYEREKKADRIIVITDEQDCDQKLNPEKANTFGKNNYLINVASHQNGVGYRNRWQHIDGWSESVIDYIQALEDAQ